MTHVNIHSSDLLHVCAESMGSHLDERHERALHGWWHEVRPRSAPFTELLLARTDIDWAGEILKHRAHRHPWYDVLADRVSVEEYAIFLLENRQFPAFLPLVERTLEAQVTDQGRAAVRHNIHDEEEPVPHAELMRRLMQAVKARAGDVPLATYPSLIDRTLVFYYGYYCDPWHLVGSLCAMEVLANDRMTKMDAGLRRLGFDPADLEYIRVHLDCDEDHAREWIDDVIVPSAERNPLLRRPIAEGTAACLETSARYLDDLRARITHQRPAQPLPQGESGAAT
jgi:pyrroloquinoline quinone (PQQ) biosynthesis protein C